MNWLDMIEEPINKQEKYQYQQLMVLYRIETLLNKLLPKEEQIAEEEVAVEEVKSLDYEFMTKTQLLKECERQGVATTSKDTKADLIKRLS